MNKNITLSTRQKINQLILFNFRLLNRPESIFAILYNIFAKEDHISNYNQMKFESCIKRNSLKFLVKMNLITRSLAQLQSKSTVPINSNSISMVSQQTFLSIVS